MKVFVPVPVSIPIEAIIIAIARSRRRRFSDYRGRHYGAYSYEITAGALEPGGWNF
jgi:hypothetical protein